MDTSCNDENCDMGQALRNEPYPSDVAKPNGFDSFCRYSEDPHSEEIPHHVNVGGYKQQAYSFVNPNENDDFIKIRDQLLHYLNAVVFKAERRFLLDRLDRSISESQSFRETRIKNAWVRATAVESDDYHFLRSKDLHSCTDMVLESSHVVSGVNSGSITTGIAIIKALIKVPLQVKIASENVLFSNEDLIEGLIPSFKGSDTVRSILSTFSIQVVDISSVSNASILSFRGPIDVFEGFNAHFSEWIVVAMKSKRAAKEAACFLPVVSHEYHDEYFTHFTSSDSEHSFKVVEQIPKTRKAIESPSCDDTCVRDIHILKTNRGIPEIPLSGEITQESRQQLVTKIVEKPSKQLGVNQCPVFDISDQQSIIADAEEGSFIPNEYCVQSGANFKDPTTDLPKLQRIWCIPKKWAKFCCRFGEECKRGLTKCTFIHIQPSVLPFSTTSDITSPVKCDGFDSLAKIRVAIDATGQKWYTAAYTTAEGIPKFQQEIILVEGGNGFQNCADGIWWYGSREHALSCLQQCIMEHFNRRKRAT